MVLQNEQKYLPKCLRFFRERVRKRMINEKPGMANQLDLADNRYLTNADIL